MNTKNRSYITPIDVHAALARAHADRAEYFRSALAGLPALAKRLAAKLPRLPHKGAWA